MRKTAMHQRNYRQRLRDKGKVSLSVYVNERVMKQLLDCQKKMSGNTRAEVVEKSIQILQHEIIRKGRHWSDIRREIYKSQTRASEA